MWNQATWEFTCFLGMGLLSLMWAGLIQICAKESSAPPRRVITEASGSITLHPRWMLTSMSASFTTSTILQTTKTMRKYLQARIGVVQSKDALGAKVLGFHVSTSRVILTSATLDSAGLHSTTLC